MRISSSLSRVLTSPALLSHTLCSTLIPIAPTFTLLVFFFLFSACVLFFDHCLFIHLFSFFPPVAICFNSDLYLPARSLLVSPAAAWSSYLGKIRFWRMGRCTMAATRTSRPMAARFAHHVCLKTLNAH